MEFQQFLGNEILDWLYADNDDESTDHILSAALDDYECTEDSTLELLTASPAHTCKGPTHLTTSSPSLSCGSTCNSRFAILKTEQEVLQARRAGIPKSTVNDTRFCYRLWEDWKKHRESMTGVKIPHITTTATTLANSIHPCGLQMVMCTLQIHFTT